MVGAYLPERGAAAHAVITGQGIHNGVLKAVPHMQSAGDIGRRDDYAVGVAVTLGREVAALFPSLIPASFELLGLVGLIHENAAYL